MEADARWIDGSAGALEIDETGPKNVFSIQAKGENPVIRRSRNPQPLVTKQLFCTVTEIIIK